MTTVTKTFSAVDQASDTMSLQAPIQGQPGINAATYTITGTFSATLVLELTRDNGATWQTVSTFTATASSTTIYGPAFGLPSIAYRFRCTVYASGSPAITLATADNVLMQFANSSGAIVFQVKESGISVNGQTPSLAGTAQTATAQRNVDVASAAGAAAISFGSSLTTGLQFYEVEQVVSLASAGAKFVAMSCTIPSGAIILSAQMNIDTLVVAGGTSVKVGLGLHGGTCNTWGNTADLLKNTKANLLGTTVLAADTMPEVCACATDATGLGDTNFSAGVVRVRIVYLKAASLPDA